VCVAPDTAWTALALASDPGTVDETVDGEIHRRVRYSARAAHVRRQDRRWAVLLEVEISNETAAVAGTFADDTYLGSGLFRHLVVGGASQGDATCLGMVSGDREIAPGQRARALIGFSSDSDPIGATVSLETFGYQSLVVTR
jgi:hypothetical protein